MIRTCAGLSLLTLLAGCSVDGPLPDLTATRAGAAEPAAKPAASKAGKTAKGKAENDKPAATPRRHALLVACTTYDHLDERNHLKGSANDVVLFRRLLIEQFKFDSASIVTLAEGPGTAGRPTKANIQRAFAALADKTKVKPGDQVVILMGGHGFYLKNDKATE